MQGDRRDRHSTQPPPLVFRFLTLAMIAVLAGGIPAAVRAAVAEPVTTLWWIALLSLSSLLVVTAIPSSRYEVTLRGPLGMASCVALTPPLAMLVNFLALASQREFKERISPWVLAFNHAMVALTAGLTSVVAHAQPFGPIVGAVVAVVVFDLTNLAFVALGAHVRGRMPLPTALRHMIAPFPSFASNFLLVGLLAVLTVVLYTQIAAWTLALLAAPTWLGYTALRSAREASDRAEELSARVRELEELNGLGAALLATRDAHSVARLATNALKAICGDHPDRDRIAVALDGHLPDGLNVWDVPGTRAKVGLPSGLDERRRMEAETVCSAIGLALGRLAVEEELGESQQAQAALASQILAEGTAARSRVALDVHDDVLPYLAAAQIQADNVLMAVKRGDLRLTTALSQAVRDGVQGGIHTLRKVLDDLQRQIIVPGDLVPSINRTGQEARVEHGLSVSIDTDDYLDRVSHPTEILLIETANGLLANVAQHAQASRVSIRLASNHRNVELEVDDDGVGFDVEQVGPGHHGLELLRQRVALAQGELTIWSSPDDGTCVRVVVPVGVPVGTPAPAAPSGLNDGTAVGPNDGAAAAGQADDPRLDTAARAAQVPPS
jgi:signal transduction histidine kinase